MAGVEVRVHIDGASDLLRALRATRGGAVRALEPAVVAGVKPWVSAATGNLGYGDVIESDIAYNDGRRVDGDVGLRHDRWYLQFFETGAREHVVKPKARGGKRFLVWEEAEQLIRTPIVHHPGMAARPFLRPAFDSEVGKAERNVEAVLKAAIEGAFLREAP